MSSYLDEEYGNELSSTKRKRRAKLSICDCNSQIFSSFILGLVATSLIVGGVYLAVKKFDYHWLILSVSGLVLVFIGAGLYYCGVESLVNKRKHELNDADLNGKYFHRRKTGVNRLLNESNSNLLKQRLMNTKRNDSLLRKKPNENLFSESRSVSQLSLNMIPQYFAAGHHTAQCPSSGFNSLRATSSSTTATTTLTNSFRHHHPHHPQSPTSHQSPTIGYSQILNLNGQNFLLLPISGPPVVTNQVTGTGNCLQMSDLLSQDVLEDTDLSSKKPSEKLTLPDANICSQSTQFSVDNSYSSHLKRQQPHHYEQLPLQQQQQQQQIQQQRPQQEPKQQQQKQSLQSKLHQNYQRKTNHTQNDCKDERKNSSKTKPIKAKTKETTRQRNFSTQTPQTTTTTIGKIDADRDESQQRDHHHHHQITSSSSSTTSGIVASSSSFSSLSSTAIATQIAATLPPPPMVPPPPPASIPPPPPPPSSSSSACMPSSTEQVSPVYTIKEERDAIVQSNANRSNRHIPSTSFWIPVSKNEKHNLPHQNAIILQQHQPSTSVYFELCNEMMSHSQQHNQSNHNQNKQRHANGKKRTYKKNKSNDTDADTHLTNSNSNSNNNNNNSNYNSNNSNRNSVISNRNSNGSHLSNRIYEEILLANAANESTPLISTPCATTSRMDGGGGGGDGVHQEVTMNMNGGGERRESSNDNSDNSVCMLINEQQEESMQTEVSELTVNANLTATPPPSYDEVYVDEREIITNSENEICLVFGTV